MNAPDVAYQVARQFAALRRRYMFVRVATAICLCAAFVFTVWAIVATIDYRWELPHEWRTTCMTATILTAVAYGCWRVVSIVRQTRQRPFAGIVERSFEDFGQRIRTVLDTVDGRVNGPREMLTALGNQTLGRWESVSPVRMVPVAALWCAAIIFVAVGCLSLGLFAVGGDMRLAMMRTVGLDQPYTQLEVTPGDIRILEGNPVEVSVDLVGRTDREVLLRYRELRPEDGVTETDQGEPIEKPEWIESELLADDDATTEGGRRKTFGTSLGKATWPIEYQFVSSGQTTKTHRITIQPLIETERIEIAVQPPEYTGLKTRKFAKPELTVLEQSVVNVTIELNHPLEHAVLEIGPKTSKLAAVELDVPDDKRRWTFQLPSMNTVRWRFSGVGADGTPMDDVKGRLGIRRDTAPSIRWREPSDEIKVHTLAEVPLGVQIADDYGIAEAGIAFQLGGDDEYILTDWAVDSETQETSDPNGSKTRLLLEEMLPLESFELTERDYIAYYAYAIDNRPWGTQRSESDVRYIDIRPLRQFYQEVDPPGGNNGGGSRVLVQLDEIIRRERFVINRTRKLIRGGSDLASELGTIDRLVENQSELADLTRFLAEFFISRGNDDVEALSQAEAAMLQASDSLAAGSLDLAMAQEQDALRSLAEARRTLEIALLTRMTVAQQQALRRLARQLRQKLRRKRPETERELADSLKQIAAQQRRVSSMAQSAANQSAANMQPAGKANQSTQMAGGSGGKPNGAETEPNTNANPGVDPNAENDSELASTPNESTEPDEENPSPDPQAEGDEPAAELAAEEEPETNPSESLFEQQIDLMERLEAVREQLGERLSQSDLMTERMDDAQAVMDELASKARDGEFQSLASGSRSASDLLEETAMQLEALAAAEPVTRVSSLRDLTSSLAGMEHRFAKSDERSRQNGAGSGDDAEAAEDALRRLANRLSARSETLREVLSSQADVGDIEMSEVNDQLQSFADQTDFLDQLDSTEAATEETSQTGKPITDEEASEAFERAVEYAEAARQLERLYQQLVTPRLARLRRMEQRANRLANRMGGGGGGEKDPENQRELRQLQKDLEQESLRDLAEMLAGGDPSDEETKAETGTGMDAMDQQEGPGAAVFVRGSVAGRVQLVAEELRKRIQQVILLEIAVDRDTPVPTEYRRAVDGYFRELASENGSTMSEASEEAATGGSL